MCKKKEPMNAKSNALQALESSRVCTRPTFTTCKFTWVTVPSDTLGIGAGSAAKPRVRFPSTGSADCHCVVTDDAPLLTVTVCCDTPERAARRQPNAHCLSILAQRDARLIGLKERQASPTVSLGAEIVSLQGHLRFTCVRALEPDSRCVI